MLKYTSMNKACSWNHPCYANQMKDPSISEMKRNSLHTYRKKSNFCHPPYQRKRATFGTLTVNEKELYSFIQWARPYCSTTSAKLSAELNLWEFHCIFVKSLEGSTRPYYSTISAKLSAELNLWECRCLFVKSLGGFFFKLGRDLFEE